MEKKFKDHIEKRLYQLSQKAKLICRPNPAVASIITKNNKILAEGHTLEFGSSHAEVVALQAVKKMEDLSEAEMWVTLSPCCHYGKTPPCTDRVIESGIKTIHIALSDPNPQVKSKSHQILKENGIKVISDISERLKWKLFCLNYDFFKRIREGLPAITLKYAMTLDGKVATFTKDSKWISNTNSRRDVHKERRLHDAILVGANTFIKDNPALNVRLTLNKKRSVKPDATEFTNPVVLIYFSYSKKEQWDSLVKKINLIKVFKTKAKVVFLIPEDEFNPKFNAKKPVSLLPPALLNLVEVLTFNPHATKNGLVGLMKKVASKFNLNSIYLEGGSRTQSLFLKHKLADKIDIYLGNQILNDGANALSPFTASSSQSLLPVKSIASAVKIKEIEYKKFIDNIKISGWLGYNNSAWEKIWQEVKTIS